MERVLISSSFVRTVKQKPKNVAEQNEKQNDIYRLQLQEIIKQYKQGNDLMNSKTERDRYLPKSSLKTTKRPKYVPKFSLLFSTWSVSVTSKTTTARERKRKSFQTLRTTKEAGGKASQKFSPLFSTTTTRKKFITRNTVKPVSVFTKKPSSRYSLHTFKAYRATVYSQPRFTRSRIKFTTKKPKATTTTSKKPVSTTVTQPNDKQASVQDEFDKQLATEASDATYNCLKDMSLDYKLSLDKIQDMFRIGRRYNTDTKMVACLILGNTYRAGLATLRETYTMRPRYAHWMQFETGYLVYDMSLKYQSLIELYYLAYTKMSEGKAPIRYIFYIYRLMTSLATLMTHLYYMFTFLKVKHAPDQVHNEDIEGLNVYSNKKGDDNYNYKETISDVFKLYSEIKKLTNTTATNSFAPSAEELERIQKIKDLMEKLIMEKKRKIQKMKGLHNLVDLNTPPTHSREPNRYNYSKIYRPYTYGWSVELE